MIVSEPPRDLDLVREGLLVVQPAHADEGAVSPALHGEQADAFGLVNVLGPLGDLVGVLPGQRLAPEGPVDLRVRVERREVCEIVLATGAQQEAWRLQDDRPVPARHWSAPRLTGRAG